MIFVVIFVVIFIVIFIAIFIAIFIVINIAIFLVIFLVNYSIQNTTNRRRFLNRQNRQTTYDKNTKTLLPDRSLDDSDRQL